MEFFHLRAGEEFIRLGQVLKAAGFVENGGQAKEVIQDGFVSVRLEILPIEISIHFQSIIVRQSWKCVVRFCLVPKNRRGYIIL